jgi:hypothetical protein
LSVSKNSSRPVVCSSVIVCAIFADAWQRQPLFRRQPGDAASLVNHGLGRVAVRADLEGILALQLQQGADVGQDGGNLGFIHRNYLTTEDTKNTEYFSPGMAESHRFTTRPRLWDTNHQR